MSIPSDASNALRTLLPALQSADNGVRTRAEEVLQTDWVAHHPDALLAGLVEQIRTNEDANVGLASNPSHYFFHRVAYVKPATDLFFRPCLMICNRMV